MNSTECIDSASAATTRIVESCPQNIKKWNEAAVRKGCEKIKHTCSSFEYHCVTNAWGNETIEICAPSLMIIGKNASIYLKIGCISISPFEHSEFRTSFEQFPFKSLLHSLTVSCRKCLHRI